jgi:O-antigen ligase
MIFDLLVVGVCVFATFAWGANELWAMGLIVMAMLGILVIRTAWDSWRNTLRLRWSPTYLPLLLFLAFCCLQVLAGNRQPATTASVWFFGSVEPYWTTIYLILFLSYLAVIYLVANGFNQRRLVKSLLIMVLALGAFEAAYGLIQYLGDYNYIWHYQRTASLKAATGTLINRNHYALLLNLCICMGIGYLYYRGTRLWEGTGLRLRRLLGSPGGGKLAWLALLLVLMGLAVVFSMSRMGIVAMCCSVASVMIAAHAAKSGRRATVIALALLVAILGLAIYTGIDPVLERYERLSAQRQSDRDRLALWGDAWKMIIQYPVFGQGLGTFQWTYPAFETVDADIPAKYAHNDYLQALAEVGIVGLTLLLWCFGSVWRVAVKNLRYIEDPLVQGIGLGTIGALTAIALQEVTDFGLYIPGVAIMAALVVGLNLRAAAMH